MKSLTIILSGLAAVCLIQSCSSEPPASKFSAARMLDPTHQSIAFMSDYQNITQKAAVMPGDETPLLVTLRIGSATDPTVCTSGEEYGPFTVTGNSVAGEATVEASPPTLRLANMGDLTVCMIITSPVDATVNIDADQLYLTTEECTEPAQNVAGTWQGVYSCQSTCDANVVDLPIELTIEQDVYSATYTDSEASYEGTVCGNQFHYSGSGPGYTESGTFTLNADGSGSKTSEYQSTLDSCSGTCFDTLSRLQ